MGEESRGLVGLHGKERNGVCVCVRKMAKLQDRPFCWRTCTCQGFRRDKQVPIKGGTCGESKTCTNITSLASTQTERPLVHCLNFFLSDVQQTARNSQISDNHVEKTKVLFMEHNRVKTVASHVLRKRELKRRWRVFDKTGTNEAIVTYLNQN